MKKLSKFIFKSILGGLISFFTFIFLIVTAIVVLSIIGKERQATVSKNSVLHINLDQSIVERGTKSPLRFFDFMGYKNKVIGLNDIVAGIKKAALDDKISGIYLDVASLSIGYASIEEIRNTLLDFKKTKKFIVAYGEVYTQGAYYLASVADKVYLNPEGMVDFFGLRAEVKFFKKALDKLEIDMQVMKVGTYKSAVEPFLFDKMSEASRTGLKSLLGSMYDHLIQKVADSRKLTKNTVHAISCQGKLRNAQDALNYKMVDGLRYKDEILSELKSRTGISEEDKIHSISIEQYAPTEKEKESQAENSIALVYATGEIISGEGDDETMGSERISKALREARTDDKIKAVVLRINSPGGSAIASEIIWREVMLIKKVKPIIVSMGDVAASGGYYIACAADSIFAQANTITGSIGVFGIIPNIQRFCNNKLGITFDRVETGLFTSVRSITKPLSEIEKNIIQQEVNHIYSSFTKKVSDGRKKSQSYIDSIGQGRVWSGIEALNNGLVDRLGNTDNAIHAAAKKAHLTNYKIVDYPKLEDRLLSLISDVSDQLSTYILKRELGENYVYYQQLQNTLQTKGIQAQLPYQIFIE